MVSRPYRPQGIAVRKPRALPWAEGWRAFGAAKKEVLAGGRLELSGQGGFEGYISVHALRIGDNPRSE